MARANREILTGGRKYKEAKRSKNRVEEVTFDSESRVTYLTGFHKRKVERKKNAQKHAEDMAKKERIEERARIREERKEQVRKKLEEMKAALVLNPFLNREDQDEPFVETGRNHGKKSVEWDDDEAEDEAWGGIKDDDEEEESEEESEEGSNSVKSILKKQIYEIDNVDAPVVGHSEVVIESLDNPNSATTVEPIDLTTIAEHMHVNLDKSGEVLDESLLRAKKYARLMGVSEKPPSMEKPKVKKKKFRYLSKAERKVNTMKERSSSAKRAPRDKGDGKDRGKDRGKTKGKGKGKGRGKERK